ncbi:MAG: hypothetical protein AB1714_03080 [Acidobacteriota bacterium]
MMKKRVVLVLLAALVASPAAAQYYGKNKVQYDVFHWDVYHSPHFDIYFYPEERMHLERMASFAESGYLKVSSDLKHQIPFAIPLIFYKTHSEFEQTHLFPDFVPEGVLAFAESVQNRMVMPIDLPADELQNLITHELTHIFEYSILYGGLSSPLVQLRSPPDWVMEGFADFEVGEWDLSSEMTIRDMTITDRLPTIGKDGQFKEEQSSVRAPYDIGHAIFDFMESRWGMDGIRQFWWSLKKGSVIGKSTLFEDALKTKASDFDQDFKKYMRDRFKDYREKEIPVDYGRDISPQGKLFSVFAMELSPSGDLIAALTGNRADAELDLVLISARDGRIIKNLTKGYTTRYQAIHYQYDPAKGDAIAWSRDGDNIAFLARTGKRRSIFLIKVTTGKIERKLPLTIDEATSPVFYPDGSALLVSGLQDGVADLFKISLADGSVTKVTDNRLVDRNPTISPDGRWLAFTVRVGKYDKLFVAPLDSPHAAEQKTWGDGNDVNPTFSRDSTRIYYSSSAPDGIYNIYTLDLASGVREQWTDVLGGNFFPTPVPGEKERVLFTSYYRGEFGLYSVELKKPISTLEPEAPQQPTIPEEFKPAVAHTLQPASLHERDKFKLLVAGQLPLNIGVATDGTFFGGTAVSFTDMLGDHNFSLIAYYLREFRSTIFTYTNLRRRLQYQLRGFDLTNFFYASSQYLDPRSAGAYESTISETYRGGRADLYYPLDLYRRLEAGAGFMRYSRDLVSGYISPSGGLFDTDSVQLFATFYAPIYAGFTQETTRYKQYGPIDGNTLHVEYEYAPGNGDSFTDRRTVYVDARKYLRISTDTLLATRFFGFQSGGKNPAVFYMGGNNTLRGVEYDRLIGDRGFFLNAELRFPFINLLSSPIGVIGPLRGLLFWDLGYARFKGDKKKFSSSDGGFHLVDGESSFGGGLQIFLFAYPFHLDFVRRTDYQQVFSGTDVRFWIGYDF